MKELLIVYPQMMMGGSTTSLLSMLNNLDYNKYSVDLLLFFEGGPLFDKIPDKVNVLPFCYKYQDKKQRIIHRFLSPRYLASLAVSKFVAIKDKNARHGFQYLSSVDVDFYNKTDKHYDIAVGFLEGYPNKYIANHVSAKRKIGWFHPDYSTCGYSAKYDRQSVSLLDKTVVVSDKCKQSFMDYLPEFADKCTVIENILSNDYIRSLAQEKVADLPVTDSGKINFVTTCRIDFSSKGLDRIINIINAHKGEEIWDKFCWYIIGDGPDYSTLDEMIKTSELTDKIHLLGSKTNPLPYEMAMDMFLLPSRFEGKPMAVTEAMMVGLAAFVTHYVAAPDQVTDGFDGVIAENNDEDIYRKLKTVLENPDMVKQMKENARSKDYSNTDEMRKIEKLFD